MFPLWKKGIYTFYLTSNPYQLGNKKTEPACGLYEGPYLQNVPSLNNSYEFEKGKKHQMYADNDTRPEYMYLLYVRLNDFNLALGGSVMFSFA